MSGEIARAKSVEKLASLWRGGCSIRRGAQKSDATVNHENFDFVEDHRSPVLWGPREPEGHGGGKVHRVASADRLDKVDRQDGKTGRASPRTGHTVERKLVRVHARFNACVRGWPLCNPPRPATRAGVICKIATEKNLTGTGTFVLWRSSVIVCTSKRQTYRRR